MKTRQLLTTLTLGLGLTLAVGLFAFIGRAAPGDPVLDPPRNSHTAPLTTTVSITYDEPISAATVTSRTFAIHGMQSGLVTATHGVSGGKIIVTPTRPFHQGELVYAIATSGTLGLDGTEPLSATQWQFNAGQIVSRCVAGFTDIKAELIGVTWGSTAWGDYDNDGDLDILITGVRDNWLGSPTSQIYRNDKGSFTNIGAGLPDVSYSSAAWGDYDNDGDLDILLSGAISGSSIASLVYRNESGSFTDIEAGLTGVASSSVAWGDYDNDGDLDILLTGATFSASVAQVYRNDGPSAGSGWTFTNVEAGLTGVEEGTVAWGDYDNDGDLDILLTGRCCYPDDDYVSLIYRNDNGSFTGISDGLPDVYISSAAWGDYDNDGDLDILLTGGGGSDRVFRVYRNDAGNFTDVVAGPTGASGNQVAWGDYDNDGDLDILLTRNSSDRVSKVYRNDAGGFTDIEAGLTGVANSSMAWGDYDDDGDLDILLAGWTGGDNYVSHIYRNNDCSPDLAIFKTVIPQVAMPGDTITYALTFSNTGTLTATQIVITDAVPVSVTVTGVISSGVAITDTGTDLPYVWQVQNLAPGEGGVITITGALSVSLPTDIFSNTATITATSVDSNLANNSNSAPLYVYVWHITATDPVANAVVAPLTTTIAATFDGDLDASSATSATFVVHGTLGGLVTGTFEYDSLGRTLMLTPSRPLHAGETVRTSATVGLLRSDGELLFPYQWQFTAGKVVSRCVGDFTDIDAGLPGVSGNSVAWGDYDNDGDLDILLTGWIGSDNRVSRVYRNDSNSFTDIGAELPGVSSSSVAWGDYDNDGDLDILLTGYTEVSPYRVSLVYRNDNGSFTDVEVGLTGVSSSSAAWGDYDNDGDLDILLTGDTGGYNFVSQIHRNDAGSFTDIGAGLIGVAWGSVAWGDYDNDGDLDILLAGWDGSVDGDSVSRVYRNDSGSFTDIGAGLSGVSSSSVAWGDYDNDGDLDILLTGNSDFGFISRVYRNDGPSTGSGWIFTDIGAGLTGVDHSSVAWGDYDNDGDLDILLTGATVDYPEYYIPVSQVYRNDAGRFIDIDAGLIGVAWSSVAWGDYDNDGDLDILLTGGDGDNSVSQVYRNDDCPLDLMLVKIITPRVAAPGEPITYTLTFANSGVLTATHVIITDTVPVSVTVSDISSSGVIITDTGAIPPYVWQVQDLAPGEGGIITITGMLSDLLPSGHIFTNTAVIATTAVDGNPNNNQADAAITVATEAELEVNKEVDNSTPHEGDTIVYTVAVTNNGPLDASGVVVSDTLPSGVSYYSDDGGGDYDNTTRAWVVGNLDNGTSATLHIMATVDAGTAGDTITNTAVIVASEQSDPVANNNQADAVITVLAEAGGDWRVYLPLVVRDYAP